MGEANIWLLLLELLIKFFFVFVVTAFNFESKQQLSQLICCKCIGPENLYGEVICVAKWS